MDNHLRGGFFLEKGKHMIKVEQNEHGRSMTASRQSRNNTELSIQAVGKEYEKSQASRAFEVGLKVLLHRKYAKDPGSLPPQLQAEAEHALQMMKNRSFNRQRAEQLLKGTVFPALVLYRKEAQKMRMHQDGHARPQDLSFDLLNATGVIGEDLQKKIKNKLRAESGATRKADARARKLEHRRLRDGIVEPDFLTDPETAELSDVVAKEQQSEPSKNVSPLIKRVAVMGGVTLTSLLAMGSFTQEVSAADVNRELKNNQDHSVVLNTEADGESELENEVGVAVADLTTLMLLEGLVAVEPVDATGIVISPTMNVRDLPSASGEASVVGQLNKDDQVQVVAKFIDGNNTWLYVDKGDGTFQWAALRYGGTDYIAVDPSALEKLPDLNRSLEALQADGTTLSRGSISLLEKSEEQQVYALLQEATHYLPHEIVDHLKVVVGDNDQIWAELSQDVQVKENINGQEKVITHQAGDVVTTQEVEGKLRVTNYLSVGQIHEVLGLPGNVRETRLLQISADFLVVTSGQEKYGLDLLKFQQMMSNTDVQQQEAAIRQASMIIVDEVPMGQLVRASLVRDASQQPTAIETPEAVFQLVSNREQILEATPPAPRPERNPMFGIEVPNLGAYQIGGCTIEGFRDSEIKIGNLTTMLIADCSYIDGNGNNRTIGVPLAMKDDQGMFKIYGGVPQSAEHLTSYFAQEAIRRSFGVNVGSQLSILFGLPNNKNAQLPDQSFVDQAIVQVYTQAQVDSFRNTGDPSVLGTNGLILPLAVHY